MAKILLIEDNQDIALMIEDSLASDRYVVESVFSGQDGADRLKFYKFDLIILDWDLPGISGIELLKRARAQGNNTPVLMLTGKTSIGDKRSGLDSGADDYLTKPFDIEELRARVRALLRRAAGAVSQVLKVRDVELDRDQFKVTRGGEELILLPREFSLLEFLMRHPGTVYTSEALLNHVWASSSDASPEALRMCLARLRKKVERPDSEPLIETIHGSGYRIKP